MVLDATWMTYCGYSFANFIDILKSKTRSSEPLVWLKESSFTSNSLGLFSPRGLGGVGVGGRGLCSCPVLYTVQFYGVLLIPFMLYFS